MAQILNFKLDPTTGDTTFDASGVLETAVDDAPGIAQGIDSRLTTFAGEIPRDLERGLDYYGEVLIKNPDLTQIESDVGDIILDAPGVESINSVTVELDGAARRMDIAWDVNATTGQISGTTSVGT